MGLMGTLSQAGAGLSGKPHGGLWLAWHCEQGDLAGDQSTTQGLGGGKASGRRAARGCSFASLVEGWAVGTWIWASRWQGDQF